MLFFLNSIIRMDSKWPFMLLTFGLLFGLGITISSIEKTVVMNNWDKRRCDFPIMIASAFFKPETDTRSSGQFAKENFNFCIKTYVDQFMEMLMIPINIIFDKQIGLTTNALNMINSLRVVTKTMYDNFKAYLDVYFKKFNKSISEISRIIQYLRMAMQKINAVMMSMVYTGISIYRGIVNTIQFIIKVILTICGIMLAIMIILIFILFPFIPMILAVIAMIIYSINILSNLFEDSSSGTLSTASSYRDGFCFSKDTIIVTENGHKKVHDIKIGDRLNNCGKVTTVIKMNGKGIKLFNLNGIYVSGSHLVKDKEWKLVKDDPRAIQTDIESDILYCFNTTTHNIPVYSNDSTIIFRDWEEMEENDTYGHYLWNYLILTTLNMSYNYSKWKDGLKVTEMPLMNLSVKTKNGFINISELHISDKILDRNGNEQEILGTIVGTTTTQNTTNTQNTQNRRNKEWHTALYEFDNGIWIKGNSTATDILEGRTLITETGEFIIWDNKEKLVRDFTEIGYNRIHETYQFISDRLRNNKI